MSEPKEDSRVPIRQKILIAFAAMLVMFALVAVMAHRSTFGLIRTAEQVNQTHQVLECQETMLRYVVEAQGAARGYAVSGQESFLQAFNDARAAAETTFARLSDLVQDNPVQCERLKTLQAPLTRKLDLLNEAIGARTTFGTFAASAVIGSAENGSVNDQIRNITDEFYVYERNLLSQRAALTHSIGRVTRLSIIAASFLTVFLLVLACILILRDIAARRRAEDALAEQHNLLRNVMDAMPERVFVRDVLGRYVIDNLAHRNFLRAKSLAEVEGKSVYDFFPREMAEMYEATDHAVLKSRKPLLNEEEPTVDEEGRLIWLSTTKVPLNDKNGNLVGLVGVSTDISQRKANEEELRLTAAQLVRSNSDLNDFAAVASHDLQEPLRKIMAFGDRLKTKCGPALGETGLDYLSRMSHAAGRMQRLIQDLLTLSRVTSKGQPFAEVDLQEVLRGVVSDLELRIEQSGARIEIGPMSKIDADALQMRQLFQNLLSNALKFQRPGAEPIVQISGKVLEVQEPQIPGAAPGEEVCQIMIEDNGIGFDPKYAEKIFTVFQRLHGKLEYEGTGIGLAVVRKIADRHGGIVSAKSAEGEGATFIVTLPVKQRMKRHDETG